MGVRPNSPPQTTSVVSSRPRALRSVSKAAIGWSTARGVVFVAGLEAAVLVPAIGTDIGAEQLDESHPSLDEPPRDQAFACIDPRRWIRSIEPIEPLSRRRFAVDTHQLGKGRLHAERQLIVGDRRFEAVVMSHAAKGALIERSPGARACGAGDQPSVRWG